MFTYYNMYILKFHTPILYSSYNCSSVVYVYIVLNFIRKLLISIYYTIYLYKNTFETQSNKMALLDFIK